jgi:hypothetical protein
MLAVATYEVTLNGAPVPAIGGSSCRLHRSPFGDSPNFRGL